MRRALIVGIDDYAEAPLQGCVHDATALSAALEKHASGAPNFDIRLLVSSATTVDRPTLKKSLEELYAGECDVTLFYFSGHGLLNTDGGYLVTQDATAYDEGVAMSLVMSLLQTSRSKNNVVILDCCHAGAFGSPSTTNFQSVDLREGTSVLTASRPQEVAVETGEGGLFTSLLIDGLEGGAADLRGAVTPGALYAYVDRALGAWEQRPMFKTYVTRFTSLRDVQPPVPLETLRRICVHFPSPSDEVALDPSFEPEGPSPNPANGQVFRELQKLAKVGLVIPVGEDHMYHAAMNSKACRLTALGYHYWRLAKEGKL